MPFDIGLIMQEQIGYVTCEEGEFFPLSTCFKKMNISEALMNQTDLPTQAYFCSKIVVSETTAWILVLT